MAVLRKQRPQISHAERARLAISVTGLSSRWIARHTAFEFHAHNGSQPGIVDGQLYASHRARVSVQCIESEGSRCLVGEQLSSFTFSYPQYGYEYYS